MILEFIKYQVEIILLLQDLAGESGDEEAILAWADMNASGTSDFQFDT